MKMEAWLLGAREPSREFITWTFNDMVIRSNHSRLILVDTGTVDDFQVSIPCMLASIVSTSTTQRAHCS